MSLRKVSFIVPLYNAQRTVAKALESMFDHRIEDVEFEVVVVDDGSTDGSVQAIGDFTSRVRLVRKDNGGEASALNEGLKHCTGDFVAIVEADVKLHPGWLRILLGEFDDPSVMGAGGRLLTPEDDTWIARLAGYEVEMKFETKERYAKHITSANAIYRREAFEVFGVFDEGLKNASVDSDFNSRIIEGGYKLVYNKDARAEHHYKPTFWGYLKRQYAYARYRMYVKNLELYPGDRFLAYNVGLCGLASLSVFSLPFYPQVTAVVFAFAILLQLPQTWRLWRRHKDCALVVYPFVMVIRNIVAAFGYGIGMLHWIIMRKEGVR